MKSTPPSTTSPEKKKRCARPYIRLGGLRPPNPLQYHVPNSSSHQHLFTSRTADCLLSFSSSFTCLSLASFLSFCFLQVRASKHILRVQISRTPGYTTYQRRRTEQTTHTNKEGQSITFTSNKENKAQVSPKTRSRAHQKRR